MRLELKRDILSVIGGIYRTFNHPNSIGYVFNPMPNGLSINNGMFCSNFDEIDHNQWEYFVSFDTYRRPNCWADKMKIYRIREDNTLKYAGDLRSFLKERELV